MSHVGVNEPGQGTKGWVVLSVQNTENPVSKEYVKALSNVMEHGVGLRLVHALDHR